MSSSPERAATVPAAATSRTTRRTWAFERDPEQGIPNQGETHELPQLGDQSRMYGSPTSITSTGPPPGLPTKSGTSPAPRASTLREMSAQIEPALKGFWDRFQGKGREVPGWAESAKTIATCSWLNFVLIIVPFAWATHYVNSFERRKGKEQTFSDDTVFALCFVALIPMKKLLDFGGEQMALYLGRFLGELVAITLDNGVEATLAIVLLVRCDIRLMQSTLTGVILLHVLLAPGIAFCYGGARITEQSLLPYIVQLNQSLLTVGVLALFAPTVFWAAVNMSANANAEPNGNTPGQLLMISRGLALMLLLVYIASRIYLIDPPGEWNILQPRDDAPEELRLEEEKLLTEKPEVNVWACLILLAVTIGVATLTTEFLADSAEGARGIISEEFFGLILLPFLSYSANVVLQLGHLIRYILKLCLGGYCPPRPMAKSAEIDLSIQFAIFWMPFLVLLGWWMNQPLLLLFDLFEVAFLIGASFLVNYVTADSKTNWVEGYVLITFWTMIALCAWFYPGQPEVRNIVQAASRCPTTPD